MSSLKPAIWRCPVMDECLGSFTTVNAAAAIPAGKGKRVLPCVQTLWIAVESCHKSCSGNEGSPTVNDLSKSRCSCLFWSSVVIGHNSVLTFLVVAAIFFILVFEILHEMQMLMHFSCQNMDFWFSSVSSYPVELLMNGVTELSQEGMVLPAPCHPRWPSFYFNIAYTEQLQIYIASDLKRINLYNTALWERSWFDLAITWVFPYCSFLKQNKQKIWKRLLIHACPKLVSPANNNHCLLLSAVSCLAASSAVMAWPRERKLTEGISTRLRTISSCPNFWFA